MEKQITKWLQGALLGVAFGIAIYPGVLVAQEYKSPSGTPTVVMSDSVLDSGGSTSRSSASFILRDSLSQNVAGEASSATKKSLLGFQYWDQTGPTVSTPYVNANNYGPDVSPLWNWEASTDLSGIYGYYIRIGTTPGGCEIIPGGLCTNSLGSAINYSADWTYQTPAQASCDNDALCSWSQPQPFTAMGMHYISIVARDLAENLGAVNEQGRYQLLAFTTCTSQGIDAGVSVGSASTTKDTTTVATNGYVANFGPLVLSEAAVAAHRVVVSQNVGNGYTLTIDQDMPLTAGTKTIPSFHSNTGMTVDNISPVDWVLPAASSGFGGFLGYHTSSVTLVSGVASRFSGTINKYAGLATGVPKEVGYSATSVSNQETDLVYKIAVNSQQPTGVYTNNVNVSCVGNY